jgi:hypothetical protein
MASFAIRSRSAGHPSHSAKTGHAPRLKPDHSIGAGQRDVQRRLPTSSKLTRINVEPRQMAEIDQYLL